MIAHDKPDYHEQFEGLNGAGRQLSPIQTGTQNCDVATTLDLLQAVPEEEVWLAGQLSSHTRRAYRQDVAHFVRALGIRSADELRKVSRAAVVAWQNQMKEQGTKPRTIRRRLAA